MPLAPRPHPIALLFSLIVTPLLWGAPKPNIVLILTDDLGWQDVGCYDIDDPCPYDTPEIDRLATLGVKFTQAYSPAPTCAPTRCAILSGKHPARTKKTHVIGGAPPTPYDMRSPGIDPWHSGRMKMEEVTIAEALGKHGYRSGAVGKWHCAIDHHAFPQAEDQGFDYSRMNIGVTKRMTPDRLSEFATSEADDKYRLDSNGFPFHQNTEDALRFLEEQSSPDSSPFFLYYATWLVHTPIHTRNEALLEKYCKRMGIERPTDASTHLLEGQKNPYYAAMVETLDYHVGRIIQQLETTDDPRNPGHKMIDNTYLIFTSDNGGMEAVPGEIITDNYPLDRGKINTKEGGIRVPYIISGPNIPRGITSHEMVSGLDFYPTILDWVGISKEQGQTLDGITLSTHLESPEKHIERDSLFWHFPHSCFQSTIRVGGDKLIYNPIADYLGKPALELYRLYGKDGTRVDIEEAHNLATKEPTLADQLYVKLKAKLTQLDANQPYLNPWCPADIPYKKGVPQPLSQHIKLTADDLLEVSATFKENGNKVMKGSVYYTMNGNQKSEEWYPANTVLTKNTLNAVIPKGATHYVFCLIDEHHYLVSYPRLKDQKESKRQYAKDSFSVPKNIIAEKRTKIKHSKSPDDTWVYKTVNGQDLFMDVFYPEGYSHNNEETYPMFLVFHGGSWSTGETSWHYPDCEYWSKRGMICASVDYRLTKRDGIKEVPLECMKDAQSAVRWVRTHAKKLKIDSSKIVVAGGSAGGQLAASLATINSPETSHADDDLSISVRPDALVLYNPYFKCAYDPSAHITSGLPPTISFLGDKDSAIKTTDILKFHEKLKSHGNQSLYYIGHGGKHGLCNGRNRKNPYFYWSLAKIDTFLVELDIIKGADKLDIPADVKRLDSSSYTYHN